nr:DUF4157 domain-containing protein [Caldilineaceae bacterium]
KVDGQEVGAKDRKGELLFELKRDGTLLKVTDKDDHLLAELTHAVTMHAIVAQLQDLAAAMQAIAELGLDVAELIPGFGQAIMVARLVASVLTFIASDEFDQLKAVLGQDGDELIAAAFKQIEESFTANVLWDWLLFGEGFPALPMLNATPRQERVIGSLPAKRGAKGRLTRLVKTLRSAAITVGGSVERLHGHITYPVRRVQVFVASKPLVALIVRLMVNNFDRLRELELAELGPAEAIGDGAERLTAIADLSTRIEEILATLNELELPDELVNLDTLVDIVLELVTNHLGGKYKVGVRLIRAGLQKIGAWDRIVAAIADELRGAHLDPNILWRTAVRDKLQPLLTTASAEFAASVTDLVTQVPFLANATGPSAPPVTVALADETADATAELEVQEFAAPDRLPGMPTPALSAVSAGSALSTELRTAAARRLGHDFSHVRLHHGLEADRVTAAFGADALTTGSHIFMRPGLNPAAGRGAHIFRHELTHVLQQTGPRPLGAPASPNAVSGRTGVGLRLDARQELAAERVAHATLNGAAPTPVDPGPLSPMAVQPSLTEVTKKFFSKAGEYTSLLERVEDIDANKPAVRGKGKPDQAAKDAAAALPAKLIDAIKALKAKGGKQRFTKPFDTAADAIVDYIINNHQAAILDAVPRLVNRSLVAPKKPGKKKSPPVPKKAPDWKLSHVHLELEVEEYLFGKTGVVFDIEFNTTATAAGGAAAIDLSDPFKKLSVAYVHLQFIGGTADLWDLIIKNTFDTNTPRLFKSKYKTTPDAVAKYKNRARSLMRAIGPNPGHFMKTQFRFSELFAKDIEGRVYPVGGAVDATLLPTAKNYLDFDHKLVFKSPVDDYNWHSSAGFIGIQFGRYDDRKTPGDPQQGKDRDAHHLTQYLVLEYLRNKKKAPNKPFKHGLGNYPGLKGAGGLANTIATDSKTVIDVAAYEKKRGGQMPTILISRIAHVYGNLHLHGEADDALDEKSTQGGAVHGMFKRALGTAYAAIMFDAKPTKLQTIQKQTKAQPVPPADQVKVGGKPVTADMLQGKIFDAACKTYTEVRTDMMRRLKAGLESNEVTYYSDTAREGKKKGKEYQLKASDLGAVLKKAESHNDEVMETEIGFEKRK